MINIPPQSQNRMPGRESELEPFAEHIRASYKGSGRLAGRCALITGGDSGIGRAVALHFAREGASVAITFLPEEADDGAEAAPSSGQDADRQEAGNGHEIESLCELIIVDAECAATIVIDEKQAEAHGEEKENDGQPVHAVCVSLVVSLKFSSLCGSACMIVRRFSSL